jgi:hypothetical protein
VRICGRENGYCCYDGGGKVDRGRAEPELTWTWKMRGREEERK